MEQAVNGIFEKSFCIHWFFHLFIISNQFTGTKSKNNIRRTHTHISWLDSKSLCECENIQVYRIMRKLCAWFVLWLEDSHFENLSVPLMNAIEVGFGYFCRIIVVFVSVRESGEFGEWIFLIFLSMAWKIQKKTHRSQKRTNYERHIKQNLSIECVCVCLCTQTHLFVWVISSISAYSHPNEYSKLGLQ